MENKILLLVLAALMVLLTACGKEDDDNGYVPVSEYILSYDPNSDYTKIFYDYGAPIIAIADREAYAEIIKNTDEFCKYEPEYKQFGYRKTYDLYSYSSETKSLEKLSIAMPEDKDALQIKSVAETADGSYLVWGCPFSKANPIFGYGRFINVKPGEGSFFLDSDYSVGMDRDSIIIDADGYVYVYYDNSGNVIDRKIDVLSPELELICTIKHDFNNFDMIHDDEGNVLIAQISGMDYYFYSIDYESAAINEFKKTGAPLLEKKLIGADGEIYGYNSIGLYRVVDPDSTNAINIDSYELIINWTTAGISYFELQNVNIARDGVVYAEIAVAADENELYMIRNVPKSEAPKRTTIRVAIEDTIFYDETQNFILNELAEIARQSEEYRVEFVYYYDTGSGLTPTQQLGHDMASKDRGIDLVIFNNSLSYIELADQHLFCDLSKYLKNDNDYNTKTLYPFVYEAYSYGGEYCCLAFESAIWTIYADPKLTGELTEWSIDDIRRINSELAEDEYLVAIPFNKDDNKAKSSLLGTFLSRMLDGMLDYSNKKCDLTELSKLLELCNEAKILDSAELYNYYELKNEKIALNFVSYDNALSYLAYKESCVDDMLELGYPSIGEKSSGASLFAGLGIGIASSSKHKNEAWNIIRQLFKGMEDLNLSEDSFSYCEFCLPITDTAIDNAAKTVDDFNVSYQSHSRILYSFDNCDIESNSTYKKNSNNQVKSSSVIKSSEALTELRELLSTMKRKSVQDSRITSIIREEASYYFSGTKSLEETMKIIENRIDTLISE